MKVENKIPVLAKLEKGGLCKISPEAYIGFREHGGKIILGRKVVIHHGCVIRTCTGIIEIGDGVSVGYYTVMHGKGGITIGKNTLISPCVQIYAQNHGISRSKVIRAQRQSGKGIVIGEDVWLGAGAIITDGVTIGNGAVVGAGSVVVENIGEYEIWAGNPAKLIGERT